MIGKEVTTPTPENRILTLLSYLKKDAKAEDFPVDLTR
jgi:hypothetical protein